MKTKWFHAKIAMTLEQLSAALSLHAFKLSSDDTDGFRVEKTTSDVLCGQFIEKESFVHHIILPTGDVINENGFNITVVDFEIHFKNPAIIRVRNPPRRINRFINKLSFATDFKAIAIPIEFNIELFIKHFENIGALVQVKYMDCSGIKLSSSTSGRFAIDGVTDVRAEFYELLGTRKYTIENIRLNLTIDRNNYDIEIFRSGIIKTKNELSSKFHETRILINAIQFAAEGLTSRCT